MLGHPPHPNLRPTDPLARVLISKDGTQIAPPPLIARRPWKGHSRSNSTSDCSSTLPPSLYSSPSGSSTLLPSVKLATDRSISPQPARLGEAALVECAIQEGGSPQARVGIQPTKLASWFSGSSEPVNITLISSPAKEKHDATGDSAEMERGSKSGSIPQELGSATRIIGSTPQKSNNKLLVNATNPAGSINFTFWKSRHTKGPEKCNVIEKELADADLQPPLLLSGTVDNPSPEEFKKLQADAENSIRRLRDAYQKSLQSLREVTSEKNVMMDELTATQTRSEQLKLQITNLATQSTERESAMQSMAEELAMLRQRIREEAEFRNRSLRLVTDGSSNTDNARSLENSIPRRKRHSEETFTSDESSSDSIFSEPPLGACTPISAADLSPDLYGAPEVEMLGLEPVKECQNCHGIRRSEAWDVVHMLKEESKALKDRIAQCENANEDALRLLGFLSAA